MFKNIIINESQYQRLFEANNNLTLRDFNSDMSKMGFSYRKGMGSRMIYELPGGNKITVHVHGDNGQIKGESLRYVKDELERIGWFNDKRNFSLFPFQKWQFSPESIKIDTSTEKIRFANEKYKDAEIGRVFYNNDNPLCYIKVEGKYNLCRDINDRRPLFGRWFDGIDYKGKDGSPRLRIDNFDTFETECYPINQDGTLDKERMMVENKIYEKGRI